MTGGEEPESGSIIVEALPDSLKECCLRVLVWPVHYDDGEMDERELCEIWVLVTQLGCNAEVRQAVCSCLEEPAGLEAREQVAGMLEHLPATSADTKLPLRCSLIRGHDPGPARRRCTACG